MSVWLPVMTYGPDVVSHDRGVPMSEGVVLDPVTFFYLPEPDVPAGTLEPNPNPGLERIASVFWQTDLDSGYQDNGWPWRWVVSGAPDGDHWVKATGFLKDGRGFDLQYGFVVGVPEPPPPDPPPPPPDPASSVSDWVTASATTLAIPSTTSPPPDPQPSVEVLMGEVGKTIDARLNDLDQRLKVLEDDLIGPGGIGGF